MKKTANQKGVSEYDLKGFGTLMESQGRSVGQNMSAFLDVPTNDSNLAYGALLVEAGQRKFMMLSEIKL
ncbi:MAG: hypothetical protein IPL53_20040 [Ignavibacteria bacterium]|nr:hypothetical protein [Ignavibacteria bacterium]